MNIFKNDVCGSLAEDPIPGTGLTQPQALSILDGPLTLKSERAQGSSSDALREGTHVCQAL